MRKTIALVFVLLLVSCSTALAVDLKCFKFDTSCDQYLVYFDPAGASFGYSNGCTGEVYNIYMMFSGLTWFMYLNLSYQNWPPDCNLGDYGLAFGMGLNGNVNFWYNCNKVGPTPVRLTACIVDDCTVAHDRMYDDCEAIWVDDLGYEITKADAITMCKTEPGAFWPCVIDCWNYPVASCDDSIDCILDNCWVH